MTNLTQKKLKEFLRYDSETGDFFWKKTYSSDRIGKMAGNIFWNGYVYIEVCGNKYLAHRLVWLYVHGKFPKNEIDHINHVKNDNSLVNLRDCTRAENIRNSTKRCDNTSGYKGVSLIKSSNKWVAKIGHIGKQRHLG